MRLTLLTLITLSAGSLPAQTPDPAFAEVADTPGLPRVLLIGDSISIGYTLPVRELLTGKANVHRILTNGGPTTNGLAHLEEWLGTGKWDVIHFNFGLHDLKIMQGGKRQVPVEEYVENLRKILERLNRTRAKLIWATTTPVPQGPVEPPRESADVIAYNLVATRIMEQAGISIDDLFAFVTPRAAAIQQPHDVHYTPEGYTALAGQVADSILKELGR
jgi:acyl-CoA thioesterase-1